MEDLMTTVGYCATGITAVLLVYIAVKAEDAVEYLQKIHKEVSTLRTDLEEKGVLEKKVEE